LIRAVDVFKFACFHAISAVSLSVFQSTFGRKSRHAALTLPAWVATVALDKEPAVR